MRRLFSKIATLSVGLAMAIGVGVAIGSKGSNAELAYADPANVSQTFQNSDSTLSTSNVTNASQESGYLLINKNKSAVATLSLSAENQQIPSSNVTIQLSIACFGSGTNPTLNSTLSGSAVGTETSSTWSGSTLTGTAPDSSSYKTVTMTLTKPGAPTRLEGIRFTLTLGDIKGIRLKSISISFSYEPKAVNHIAASVKNPSDWYNGSTFTTSDVSVTPYFSEDDSDPGITVTDGTGVKFGDSANLDSVTLVEGANSIKVNLSGKSTTINVTAKPTPVITGVVVGGDMTKKTYSLNENWDYTGLYLTVSWTQEKADTTVQFTSLSITANPAKANNTSIKSVALSGTYEGFDFEKTVTGITVTVEPVVITFTNADSAGSNWKPASSSSYTDSIGNTATISVADTVGYSGNGVPVQIGSKDHPTTYVNITITLAERAGIVSASATFCSANGATASLEVFGDDESDAIFSGSVIGNAGVEDKTVDGSYQTINASTLHFNFTCATGIKLKTISYTIGDTVAEFGNFTTLVVAQEASTKQFRVGDKFSYEGLTLRAGDDSLPVITKDYSTGFKVGTALNDNSYADYTFVAADAENSPITVHATLTIKEVTKEITYQITVTEVPTYNLVENVDNLFEGAKVLIVGGGFGVAGHTGTVATHSSALTVTDGVISDPKDAVEFTVRVYGSKIALQYGTKYLAYQKVNDEKRKQVYLIDELNDSASWTYNGTTLLSNVAGRYLVYDSSLNPSGYGCEDSGEHVQLFLSNKSVNTDTSAAETYAYRYLHMRDYTVADGSCMTYYGTAKTKFADLTAEQKAEFVKITAAVERLQAWAEANNESFDPDSKTFTKLFVENYVKGSSANYAIIIIVATVSITALGLTLMIVKKKKRD